MILPEAVYLLVLKLNWKNILLLNANDENSVCLLRLLNNAGKSVTLLGTDDIETFPWPGRLITKAPIDGFLLMVTSQEHLIKIINLLQRKYMITINHRWIFGVAETLCLKDISPELGEGNQVLILGNNVSNYECIIHEENERILQAKKKGLNQDITMWTLHSLGNGSKHFVEISLQNLSSINKLFDTPFKNFRNRTLIISSLGSPPIRIPPEANSKRWGGYIFQIINTLADIFNFTYVVKESDGRLYGMAQEDGSWTGMIGELTKKIVDIGAGDLSWTLERYMVIDLTNPVFPETNTFIYRAPDFYSRTWILFQGIESKVWIGMISASIVAFAAYFLALSMHRLWGDFAIDPTTVCIESADESISSLYRALLGKGVIHVPFPISCRTVLGTWFVATLILNVLYGGCLTSKLSLHKSPKPADSLKELLGRHPDAILAMRNNSQIHQIFKQSTTWHKVWLKNMKNYVIPGHLQIKDTMEKVHRSRDNSKPYVWIAERSMLVKMMQIYSDDPIVCDLYVAKESIVRSDWAIALQRDSPFTPQFNDMIQRMQRFGLMEKWRREFWESATGSCHPNDGLNESGETPITINDTQALFFVLAIGWVVGLVTLIVERYEYSKTHF